MRKTLIIATVALSLALSRGANASDPDAGSNETVAGDVTSIDAAANRITIRSADGKLHEFEATKATLDDLEVGDSLKAKKRAASK